MHNMSIGSMDDDWFTITVRNSITLYRVLYMNIHKELHI